MAKATLTLLKRALIRDDGYPVGVAAPLHIECCGNTIPHAEQMTCPTCGTRYDASGWVIR